MWASACLVVFLCSAGFSISHALNYGTPTTATLTGTSSKLAPGAHHYVAPPPLPYYNGFAYRPLPQYMPSWSPYMYRPYGFGGFGGGFGGYGGGFGGYGGGFGGYGGGFGYPPPHYGYGYPPPHYGYGYPPRRQYRPQAPAPTSDGDDSSDDTRAGREYAGRENYGSGFVEQGNYMNGYQSQPAQYSQHIQQVADYMPIANQMALAFDDPISPYEGTHFTKADPHTTYGMDMAPPSSGTDHLPSIYQTGKHTRKRRSLGHPGSRYGGYGMGGYNPYASRQMYHPNWDTRYQRLSGYNKNIGYGNYNPYVFDYQTSASLDDPLLKAHYPSDYYGYSMQALPSLRPNNPFQNQAPGLALNPHYQYSRAAYRNYLHESMDGADPVEYVKNTMKE